MTLRFADEGIDKLRETAGDDPDKLRDAAEHQAMLWLRRLRRKDKGVIPFYTLSASDMDGDTGELVRLHVHICMETDGSLSWDALRDAWTLGSVNIRSLRGQDDYSPIAYYMLKQVRRVPDRKKYKVSRGAALPTTEEREVVLCTKMRAEGREGAGGRYVEGEAGAYLRYVPASAAKARRAQTNGPRAARKRRKSRKKVDSRSARGMRRRGPNKRARDGICRADHTGGLCLSGARAGMGPLCRHGIADIVHTREARG
ncbi:MAG: hypothetical protein ACLUVB_00505 [Acutalibacteraceae bacterium]